MSVDPWWVWPKANGWGLLLERKSALAWALLSDRTSATRTETRLVPTCGTWYSTYMELQGNQLPNGGELHWETDANRSMMALCQSTSCNRATALLRMQCQARSKRRKTRINNERKVTKTIGQKSGNGLVRRSKWVLYAVKTASSCTYTTAEYFQRSSGLDRRGHWNVSKDAPNC